MNLETFETAKYLRNTIDEYSRLNTKMVNSAVTIDTNTGRFTLSENVRQEFCDFITTRIEELKKEFKKL